MGMLHRGFASAGAGIVLVLCLGLVACGVTTSTTVTSGITGTPGTAGATSSCGTPAAPPATGVTTGVATVVGTAWGQFGTPATTPPGGAALPTFPPLPGAIVTPRQLTVSTDRNRYSACQNIQVVIANGLPSTIYAVDHQTSCTVVTLQRQISDAWQATGGCLLATVTRFYAINRSTAVAQILHPGSGSLRSQPGGWAAGTYRIAFKWFLGGPNALHPSPTVYSSPFTIS